MLVETAPGITVQDILAATDADLVVPDQVPTMDV
jgi:acyl CoA:acetate/3-ketoacid CoA transferase beta subunit